MSLKHLLQFLGVKRTRAIVIKLKEDILNVILGLELGFSLDIEVLCCFHMAGHEPVLSVQTAHHLTHIAKQKQKRNVNKLVHASHRDRQQKDNQKSLNQKWL